MTFFFPQMIATKLRYPTGTVKHIAVDEDVDGYLSMVDLVIYGSFYEEQSFPEILKRAMCLEKPIIAPDHALIKKYVSLYIYYVAFTEHLCTLISIHLYNSTQRTYSNVFISSITEPRTFCCF